MIPSFVLLGAMLLPDPASHHFSPIDPAPVTIASDNVELDGAGQFDFKADLAGFQVDPPAGDGGISTTVRLWLDANGHPASCDIGNSSIPQAAQAGCGQLMKSARFQLTPGYALPFRRGFVDVEFSFFKDPAHGSKGTYMFASPTPGYTNTSIIYPADDTPTDRILQHGDGAVSIALTAKDYPPIALRHSLESSSAILLGISRDGRIQSCRPLNLPGVSSTAYLDNYTCALFMQRAHFEFQSASPAYEGLHYWRSKMAWKLPR